jgi:hypothetical protein
MQVQPVDSVARLCRISRATLYRYLDRCKKGLLSVYGLWPSAACEGELVLMAL